MRKQTAGQWLRLGLFGLRLGLFGGAALMASSVALGCADEGCYPQWSLANGGGDCAGRIAIGPGNDSRVNLLLLASERAGMTFAPHAYPKPDWNADGFGHVFINWSIMRNALVPPPPGDAVFTGASGSRCDGLAHAGEAFSAALAQARGLRPGEREALETARLRLAAVCGQKQADRPFAGKPAAVPPVPDWPQSIESAPGRAWLAYLQAAEAFYGEHWDLARQGFAGLVHAPDPWLAETALYMAVRVEIGAAQAGAFDKWGFYNDGAGLDQPAVARAGAALASYEAAYPAGRYHASAVGLERRVLWLADDYITLGKRYEAMLGAAPAQSAQMLDLIDEVDNKLMYGRKSQDRIAGGPLLIAASDLMQMRRYDGDDDRLATAPHLSANMLAGQAQSFARDPALYAFVQANYAFYVQHDYARVMALLPDASHLPAYTPLAFSAQVLRGQALAMRGDRNEAGFWRDMLHGATSPWQASTVQLGLALQQERHGQLAAVFAPGALVTDPDLRAILINHSAGPALLRSVAAGGGLTAQERHLALYVLLYKALRRGDYAGFLANRAMLDGVPAPAPRAPDDYSAQPVGPVVFANGKTSEGFACPALVNTVTTLAAHGSDAHAQLCLGEFLRLNDLDGQQMPDIAPKSSQLGGTVADFHGTPIGRGAFYRNVIGQPSATASDKAYALYRTVMCYAPSGYDSECGLNLSKPERKAMFTQLKQNYPTSPWAQKLRYYW